MIFWSVFRMIQLLMLKEFFPRFRVTDIGVLILSAMMGIGYLLTADNGQNFPLFSGILPLIWCAVQYGYYRSVIRKGVPVNVVMKDYRLKRVREISHRRGFLNTTYVPPREYTIYAPIMEYQAGTETMTSVYSMYELSPKWKYDETYQIYYVPSNPALFWFPGQETALTDGYLIGICTLAVMLGFWLIFNLIA